MPLDFGTRPLPERLLILARQMNYANEGNRIMAAAMEEAATELRLAASGARVVWLRPDQPALKPQPPPPPR